MVELKNDGEETYTGLGSDRNSNSGNKDQSKAIEGNLSICPSYLYIFIIDIFFVCYMLIS